MGILFEQGSEQTGSLAKNLKEISCEMEICQSMMIPKTSAKVHSFSKYLESVLANHA